MTSGVRPVGRETVQEPMWLAWLAWLSTMPFAGGCRVLVRPLGPVDVTVGGVPRLVSGTRRKAVLAVLALQVRQIVSTDRLTEAVWGGDAPATALNTLQSHVSYLRRVLGARTALVARGSGYVLDIAAEATDVERAELLVQRARQSPDPAERASWLNAAL